MNTDLRASLINSGSTDSLGSLGSTDSSGSSESASQSEQVGNLGGTKVSIADTISGGLSALKQKAASTFQGSSQKPSSESYSDRQDRIDKDAQLATLKQPLLGQDAGRISDFSKDLGTYVPPNVR